MALTLYLVRHGQTDCSLQNRMCGSGVDIPLNDTGMRMAAALGDVLGGEQWDAIYSSPLLRAQQTAAPLAQRAGLPVRIEDGLREIAYGAWEGQLGDAVQREQPDAWRAWGEDPGRNGPPGGENAVQVAARVIPVVEAIYRRHPSGRVIVFAHKATIRIVVCTLLGIDVGLFRKRIDCLVGAVTVFEFRRDGPLLRRLNDVLHLPPELREPKGT